MDIPSSNLLSESIFDFGKWSNWKYTHHIYVYFPFDHFLKSKIGSESRDEMRMSIFLFFLKRFGQYLKKSKNGFPIVFSKSDLTGIGSFFKEFFF